MNEKKRHFVFGQKKNRRKLFIVLLLILFRKTAEKRMAHEECVIEKNWNHQVTNSPYALDQSISSVKRTSSENAKKNKENRTVNAIEIYDLNVNYRNRELMKQLWVTKQQRQDNEIKTKQSFCTFSISIFQFFCCSVSFSLSFHSHCALNLVCLLFVCVSFSSFISCNFCCQSLKTSCANFQFTLIRLSTLWARDIIRQKLQSTKSEKGEK